MPIGFNMQRMQCHCFIQVNKRIIPQRHNRRYIINVLFNKAFENPYTDLQKDVLKALADPKLTTKIFDTLITKARSEIAPASFEVAKAAVKAEPACADYSVELTPVSLHVDEQAKNLSDDETARVRFVGMLLQNDALQRMMIPKRSRRDNKGNVYHYFFQSRHVDYLASDDEAVHSNLREAVVMHRLADRMQEAVAYAIEPRYVLHVDTGTFGYNGVDGFQLKSAVADPVKWLAQIFVTARMQKNPELVTERRIIERGTKTFEKAYDLP